MSRRPELSAEHGFTLAAVMLILLATSILGAAAFAAVGTDIPFARDSQDRKQAYAAAEAGIEYYLYQLTRDNDYWTNCDDVEDPGDGQPSPVNLEDPGGGRTWRTLSNTDAQFSIELLPAPGADTCVKGDETTMLNENSGTFRIRSTGESRGIRRSIVTTMRRTSFLDYLYFTDYEASDPNSFASTQDQNTARTYCVQYRQIRNQVQWCRDNVNITFPRWDAIRGPLHTNDDLLTCGSPTFGRLGEEDVIEVHGPAPGGFTPSGGGGCSGTPTFHGPVRQPAEHLPVPTSNTALKQAADQAYVFQGKTDIVFDGTSNMRVTRYPGGVATTTTMALPANGVIYVEKNGACSLQAPRQIDYNRPGEHTCAILTVHGTYPKSMTLGSEDDVLIDGDLRADASKPVLGLIANRFVRVKHDVSGACGGNTTSGPHAVREDYHIEAAILALRDSFVVDNYQCGGALGTLTVFGAIAQKFRGPVGTFSGSTLNSGYEKDYNYNDALRYRSPPYFLDPMQAAWRVIRANEQVPAAH
jgi:type II secretory pathway pseudopilin PulG